MEWAIGLPDPASYLDVSIGKSRTVGRDEARDPQSGGRGLPNDEQPANTPTLPASLLGQLRRQAGLAVEPVEHRLRVRNNGLDLDHEQARRGRVPRQNVDRAALAQDRERHLDRDIPASFAEQYHRRVDESGVRLIEQPIEAFAAPAQLQIEARTQCTCDSAQDPERNDRNLAALDLRNHPSRYVGQTSEILLSEAASNAKRPKTSAENDIHRARVCSGSLNRRFTRPSLRLLRRTAARAAYDPPR
jgi:hypothetical protein